MDFSDVPRRISFDFGKLNYLHNTVANLYVNKIQPLYSKAQLFELSLLNNELAGFNN